MLSRRRRSSGWAVRPWAFDGCGSPNDLADQATRRTPDLRSYSSDFGPPAPCSLESCHAIVGVGIPKLARANGEAVRKRVVGTEGDAVDFPPGLDVVLNYQFLAGMRTPEAVAYAGQSMQSWQFDRKTRQHGVTVPVHQGDCLRD